MAAATPVQFRKYHGLGNDFILVDQRATGKMEPILTPAQVGEGSKQMSLRC